MSRGFREAPTHPLVEHWDDERELGNGIIVTLRLGHFFYDDCGVMGFDAVKDALSAIRELARRQRDGANRP
ncbi:hypothetical protein [Mesorhizobium xinjiangense]|uniref:hypothetical protein n=1 Tax=Mesorhizobium xinjiangense TaxID=2678685 RepID=UPI0012EDC9DF|nr:hypothetical protein [Mesorhizobium xinjiangense]